MDKLRTKKGKAVEDEGGRRLTNALRVACAKQHGTALRPYIEHLQEINSTLPERIRALIREFVGGMQSLPLDGALQHACRNFGLLYAGGALAIEAGLLPCSEDDLRADLSRMFMQSLKHINIQESRETIMLKILSSKLVAGALISQEKLTLKNYKTVHGFYVRTKAGKRYTIHANSFRRWFPDRHLFEFSLGYLKGKANLIVKDTKKKRLQKRTGP